MRPSLANISTDFINRRETRAKESDQEMATCGALGPSKGKHPALPTRTLCFLLVSPVALQKPEAKVSLVDTVRRVSIWPRAVKRVGSEPGGVGAMEKPLHSYLPLLSQPY